MDWIEYDDVSVQALPEWARVAGVRFAAAPGSVSIVPNGVVLRRGERASALRWTDVLASIRVDDARGPRLLLAAARRPPHPPWFDLGGDELTAIGEGVRVGVARISECDYRTARPVRPALNPADMLEAVLSHDPVPGGVEICAPDARTKGRAIQTAIATASVTGFLGFALVVQAAPGEFLIGLGCGTAAAAATVGAVALDFVRRAPRPRVLVLTPDGFVGGLDGGEIHAFLWSRVAGFASGRNAEGQPALEVRALDGGLASRTEARFFGEPLDVIVNVAEAYRRRAVATLV